MTRAQRILGTVIVLLLVAAGIYWFLFRQPTPEPTPNLTRSLTGLTGPVRATLVPTSVEPNAKRDDPMSLWKHAFTTMTNDPHTEALLSDLCGGLRVKFAILPDDVNNRTLDKISLDPGYDLAFRIRSNFAEQGKSRAEDGSDVLYLSVAFEYSDTIPSGSSVEGLGGSLALRLVMEDYFLRRTNGWRLIWESVFDNLYVAAHAKKTPGSQVLRADLDHRLQQQAAHAKTWRKNQDAKKGR